jgi:hypothetical protein
MKSVRLYWKGVKLPLTNLQIGDKRAPLWLNEGLVARSLKLVSVL